MLRTCLGILSSWVALVGGAHQHFTDVLRGIETAGLLNYFDDITSDYPENFCQSCKSVFKEACATAGQRTWQELPTVFGLPSWEDLEKKRLTH